MNNSYFIRKEVPVQTLPAGLRTDYHVLTDIIITECVERGVGTLAVSWSENVCDSGRSKTGDKTLHTWPFGRESGTFRTREQVVSWTSREPICGTGSSGVYPEEGIIQISETLSTG